MNENGTLVYVIEAKPATKKNSSQIFINQATGRPFVAPSKAYKAFELAAGYFIRPKPKKPIDSPVNCRYTFFMHRRGAVDETNLTEAVGDILVKYGVLKDDNRDIVAGHDGTRVYYDKDRPRVEIVITPLTEPYKQWGNEKK